MPAMTMELLPQRPADEAEPESCDSAEDSRRGHDSEEIPETPDKCPALQLRREQSPCKRRRADEAGQEPDVSGKVF